MDFLMPRKDFEELVRLAPTELPENLELLEPRTTKGYVMAFAKLSRKDTVFLEKVDEYVKYHNGICVDIFPMDYWPQDKKKRDRVAFRCYCLARLCVLATYTKTKLPPTLTGVKRAALRCGFGLISGFLKLLHITTPKIYKKYRKLAASTTPEDAEHYVTDMCWCWPRRDGMIGLQYKDEGLFTPLEVPFENTTIPVPADYEVYLKTAYRDYMTLPPEEKRHSHKPSVLKFPEDMQQGM